MEKTQLPGTDLQISRVSYGAGTIAGLMVSGTPEEQVSTIAKAFELGINHFDTAFRYGWGRSEVNLGRALREVGEPHVITTKSEVSFEDLDSGIAAVTFKRSLERSLVRLGKEKVDIVLVHNATNFLRHNESIPDLPHVSLNDLLGSGGLWEAFTELRAQGKVDYFGISGQDNNGAAVKSVVASGKISVFNQPYNLLNPTAGLQQLRAGRNFGPAFRSDRNFLDFEGTIDFAARNGVGCSVISPVAAGTLTVARQRGAPMPSHQHGETRYRGGPEEFATAIALAGRFDAIAKRFDMTVTELAYRFVLSTPGVVTVVGGFSEARQIEECVAGANKGSLPGEVLAAIADEWSR